MKYFVTFDHGASDAEAYAVELTERHGELEISVDGRPMDLTYDEADGLGQVVILHEGRSYAISIEGDEHTVGVTLAGHYYGMELEDERERAAMLAERSTSKGGGVLNAVMPGVVVEVLVEPGQMVHADQPLLILEAMKMQNEIRASAEGVVESIHADAGQAVVAGDALLTLKAPGPEPEPE